ncbi:hypothetical protein ACP70R_048493 [Stipagrostis hirtigluma subsp. patula]
MPEATTGNRLVWVLLLRVPSGFTAIYIESDHREAYLAQPRGDTGVLNVIRDLYRIMHREVCHELGAFYYPEQPIGRFSELYRW